MQVRELLQAPTVELASRVRLSTGLLEFRAGSSTDRFRQKRQTMKEPWYCRSALRNLFWFLYLPWAFERHLKKTDLTEKEQANG